MTNRVVLVTGASAGIGKATADALHTAGWTVIGASRTPAPNTEWESVTMDVDDDIVVSGGVEHLLEAHGRLDAVVACAGWGLAGAAEQTPIDEAHAQLQTNFWGVAHVVDAVLGPMRDHGGGRIVIMSSIGGLLGIPFQAFYSASKFALEGYAEALAYEVAPFNIEVTLVEPGNVATEFTARRRTVDAPEHDVYRDAREKAIGVMERDERNGCEPAAVARVVEKVLDAKRPPRRVSVGKVDERIGPLAKRLLPFRLFERAARGSLGV